MDRPRLKVLYISQGYTTHDRRFLASFARVGWSALHLPLTGERLDARAVPDKVRQLAPAANRPPASRGEWLSRVRQVRTLIQSERPDVVIAGPLQSGALVAALAGAEVLVAVSWGSDVLVEADTTELCGHATSRALDASSLVFGDCRAVREAVKRHSGVPDERIVTFPWGIDLDRFHPGASSLDLRSRVGWEDAKIFLSTRTWEPVYAIDVLIRAFARVHRELPSARLLLLGDGSLHDVINRTIAEHGLTGAVHAPGRVAAEVIPDYFRAADVYVSSAMSDGTSVSLLEAMASGLPVVVSNSYGNLEWVEPGVNGELAAPGDATSLARAMAGIIDNGDARVAMGGRNIEVARERANWDTNFPELAAAVERVVRA